LAGKEFKLSKSRGDALVLSARVIGVGGRWMTPIDIEQSRLQHKAVFDNTRPFSERLPDFFRLDTKVTYRMNGKRFTQEWSLDIQNITNHLNLFGRAYNDASGKLVDQKQVGFFPVVLYRITF
jgi:hypothetical protein